MNEAELKQLEDGIDDIAYDYLSTVEQGNFMCRIKGFLAAWAAKPQPVSTAPVQSVPVVASITHHNLKTGTVQPQTRPDVVITRLRDDLFSASKEGETIYESTADGINRSMVQLGWIQPQPRTEEVRELLEKINIITRKWASLSDSRGWISGAIEEALAKLDKGDTDDRD